VGLVVARGRKVVAVEVAGAESGPNNSLGAQGVLDPHVVHVLRAVG